MMTRRVRCAWVAVVAVGVVTGGGPVGAINERQPPLRALIEGTDAILVARVERVDPGRPAAWLTVARALKGKAPAPGMAINLAGDAAGDSQRLLDRLAPGLPVVVFVTENDGKWLALGFSNGTWFEVLGRPDGPHVRWAFTHCEKYLRRTFKGTTAELERVIADALAGKAALPRPNPKEPPGLGPVAGESR